MEIINITHPGQAPIDGDWVEYHYNNGAIERKTYFEPVVTPVADTWLISVGAFFDRFGANKIPILASADAGIQAMVKDAQVRKWIDLQRPDLSGMLDYIIAAGFAVDKAAILTTPATQAELP